MRYSCYNLAAPLLVFLLLLGFFKNCALHIVKGFAHIFKFLNALIFNVFAVIAVFYSLCGGAQCINGRRNLSVNDF